MSPEQTISPVVAEKSAVLDDYDGVEWAIGVITNQFASEGCSFLIETVDNALLHPLQLNERFQQNGLRVRFEARLSRAPITDGCHKGELVILDRIELAPN